MMEASNADDFQDPKSKQYFKMAIFNFLRWQPLSLPTGLWRLILAPGRRYPQFVFSNDRKGCRKDPHGLYHFFFFHFISFLFFFFWFWGDGKIHWGMVTTLIGETKVKRTTKDTSGLNLIKRLNTVACGIRTECYKVSPHSEHKLSAHNVL